MASLINTSRPPAFCPGCAHERVVQALDQAFAQLGLNGQDVAIVSDIGCSGLFDTFFHTHALHGLHGRALTYAAGIKAMQPGLRVVATMGDGGIGIGGAHFLSACRRNMDITLLVLNNFNFGMTGGQCSATTPTDAEVGSGFLNQLEPPLDICRVADAAGAPFVYRCSAYDRQLPAHLAEAIDFNGFAVLDIMGACPGRYTRKNRLSPKAIDAHIASLPRYSGPLAANQRESYRDAYGARLGNETVAPMPQGTGLPKTAPPDKHWRLLLLGDAGQRVLTAGEIIATAGMAAGYHASQKNDYPITVLRGHSVSEVILSPTPIGYTGISVPDVVLAFGGQGVERRRQVFDILPSESLVFKSKDVDIPETAATVVEVDFKARRIKSGDRAMALAALLAHRECAVTVPGIEAAVSHRFAGTTREAVLNLVARMAPEA